MAKTRRKDYTLYLKLNGKEIELLKGTLGEIDNFTTYFVSASSMYRKFMRSSNENFKYEFFIKSSKNNRYPVLYYKYRKLLNSSNVNQVMAYLKQLSREELISFLDNFTPIVYYIENDVNDNRIPICELYNNLTNNLDYNYSLDKYIKSDYKNYRISTIYIIDRYDLNLEDFPFLDRSNVDKIILNIQNNLTNLLPTINKKTKVINSNDNLLDDRVETLDDKIYMIINNNNLDTYEKEEELELLIDDEDKLRAAKELLYQKRM